LNSFIIEQDVPDTPKQRSKVTISARNNTSRYRTQNLVTSSEEMSKSASDKMPPILQEKMRGFTLNNDAKAPTENEQDWKRGKLSDIIGQLQRFGVDKDSLYRDYQSMFLADGQWVCPVKQLERMVVCTPSRLGFSH